MTDNRLHTPALHAGAVPFSRPPTPSAHPLQIGFCGLGAMGYFMARNLANSRKSHLSPLLVYNRTVAKSDMLLAELGASAIKIANTPNQLVTECDVIFTNLANDTAVMGVYTEFTKSLAQLPPTRVKIFVETSTIYPTLAGDLDRLLSSFPHTHFVTSPVFGAPPAANSATLVIVMSGDYRSKKEVAFLLVPAVGRKVIDLGGNVEKAPTLKLIGNGMIMGVNEILAETLTFGEKSGIGQQTVYDVLKEFMPFPTLISYGNKMVNDLFDGNVGFAIDGGIKDSNHIRRLSAELNCPMPAVDNAHRSLVSARAMHQAQMEAGTQQWDIMDWSASIASSRVAAGLNPFNSQEGTKVIREEIGSSAKVK